MSDMTKTNARKMTELSKDTIATAHTPPDPMAEWKRKFVEIANATNAAMTGSMDEVWDIVDRHDVVAAVWQDASEPNGVGMLIVKGLALLRRTAESQTATEARISAVSCVEAAQAYALADVIGERDSRH